MGIKEFNYFHNPEVTGSTPVLATKKLSFNNQRISIANPFFLLKLFQVTTNGKNFHINLFI